MRLCLFLVLLLLLSNNRLVHSFSASSAAWTTPSTKSRTAAAETHASRERYFAYLRNQRVLIVGDGDFSFSQSLSTLALARAVCGSTKENQTRLFSCFPAAQQHVSTMTRDLAQQVLYQIDATDLLPSLSSQGVEQVFDVVLWNFPHVDGKQNIRKNRELLLDFLRSAAQPSRQWRDAGGAGHVMLTLCAGQSGCDAEEKLALDRSWQLVSAATNAGYLLIDRGPFAPQWLPGYHPQGHRGFGGAFPIPRSEWLLLSLPLSPAIKYHQPVASVRAIQCNVFAHEMHFALAPLMFPLNLTAFETQVHSAVAEILTTHSHASVAPWTESSAAAPVWSVAAVDLYGYPMPGHAPESRLFIAVQVAYGSLTCPITRDAADEWRKAVESQLPAMLGLSTRQSKLGHCISKALPWFVASALHALDTDEEQMVYPSVAEDLAAGSLDVEEVRRIGRRLWRKRTGVLLQLPQPRPT